MKNKNKSAKIQKYVQEVQKQALSATSSNKPESIGPSKKELEQKRKAELAELFKPIQSVQKVPFGVDPKTVVCIYFKQGLCQKGTKCKFSHDINVERKVNKIDVYTDKRDLDPKENDTMDTWDVSKLEMVVTSKHGNPRTSTAIVCRYFLEAIEDNKYGWFWTCPNGGDQCKYRHALPEGYVLKKDRKRTDDTATITLEEFLETERHKLGPNVTPLTLETFTQWKQAQLDRALKTEDALTKAKQAQIQAGRKQGLSGRDLFTFDASQVRSEENEDDDNVGEMDLSAFLKEKAAEENENENENDVCSHFNQLSFDSSDH